MLNVQNYLKTEGNTLETLKSELGIEYVLSNDEDNLVILNYNQIDSPKVHPIVRECRGLVLEVGTWKIIATAFPRFYNWGEVQEELKDFNWNSFTCTHKEDGSLILVYNHNGKWRINSRGSFGKTTVNDSGKTWDDAVRPLLKDKFVNMSHSNDFAGYTYVFEYCSLENKIITMYPEPRLFLIGMFQIVGGQLINDQDCNNFLNFEAKRVGLERPTLFEFKSLDEIKCFLDDIETKDPTNEGVVIFDGSTRWKLKNKAYLGLHSLWSGQFVPRRIFPFILNNDTDELLTYFPEVKESIDRLEKQMYNELDKLIDVWKENWHIKDRKEFAIAIKGKTQFTSVLFNMKNKFGDSDITEQDVKYEYMAYLKDKLNTRNKVYFE